jgi:GntR family transcriptional regulator
METVNRKEVNGVVIAFKLDPKSGVPFYRQIIDQIRYGIAAGQLKVGEQLPTVRALAVELEVNPNTISKAYRELEIQNILETQQGTGTFIGPVHVEIPEEERRAKLRSICDEFVTIASSYGFLVEEIIRELQHKKGGTGK